MGGRVASSQGTDADKGALRQGYLSARSRLDGAVKVALDRRIRASLDDLDAFRDAELVLAYVSQGAEVDTREIISSLLAAGRRVGVPLVDARAHALSFHEIGSLDELRPGFSGILEPAPRDGSLLTMEDFFGSVCLVPGLVFDADGHRVGYGGGYYDRFLPRLEQFPVQVAALVYDEELVASGTFSVAPHDMPVDLVITPGGTRHFLD